MGYADKNKQREYQRLRSAKIRAEWFKDKFCVVCKATTNLQLDHIDPTTKIHHAIWSWAVSRRNAELAKCQALCAKCHKEKTLRERRKAPHGRDQRYNLGCRCKLCVEFKRQKNKKRTR